MWKRAAVTLLITGGMMFPWAAGAAQWRYHQGDARIEAAPPQAMGEDTSAALPALDIDAAVPRNNMTKDAVRKKFGEPQEKISEVGEPPISRWRYPAYTVYFERDRVIVAVSNQVGPER